jgi:hypothetical protein
MRKNKGWELLIVRLHKQWRNGKVRTVGTYHIYHDGVPTELFGWTAESPIPGSNAKPGNRRAVETGTYPLWTQQGSHYVTIGYKVAGPNDMPKPGVELKDTGNRKEILIHPGHDFLASVGCINLTSHLASGQEDINWKDSQKRVIAMIEDMKKYLGKNFPKINGMPIPKASVVIVEA